MIPVEAVNVPANHLNHAADIGWAVAFAARAIHI